VAEGGRAVSTPSWDGHLLLLHHTEADRLTRLAEWVLCGLDRGEKVIYADGGDAAGSSIVGHLRGQGIDVAAARAEGRFELLPLAAFYPSEVVDRALDEGFPAVRMSAEAAAVLSVLEPAEYRDVEQNMDRLCRTGPVSALCQYPRSTSAPTLRAVVSAHPHGVREPGFSASAGRFGLALHGEVDLANADVLAAVLAAALLAAMSAPGGEVRLDLAALEFIDVAACRAISDASRIFRETGRRLLLVDARRPVERMMGVLGLGDLPGMELIRSAP
jgi:anti-anti-sigma factor